MVSSPPPKHYSDPTLYPMEGGCSCGLLRYKLLQAPIVVHCCHCTLCQRETGSAFAINAFLESDQVQVLPPAAPTIPASVSDPREESLKPASPSPPGWTGPVNDDGTVDPVHGVSPSESGRGVRMAKCPRCMVCVWSHYDGGPGDVMKAVRAGTLDRAWLVEPDVHIFARSKRPFVSLADGKPVWQEFYDNREWFRPEVKERWGRVIAKIQEHNRKKEEA